MSEETRALTPPLEERLNAMASHPMALFDREWPEVQADLRAAAAALAAPQEQPREPERRKSIMRLNAERDPSYCPYCLRCTGLVRMRIVEPFLWRCRCGATCDVRESVPLPSPSERAEPCDDLSITDRQRLEFLESDYPKVVATMRREAQLACDLRTSQDAVIERCAKAIEGRWPEAAAALRRHEDGISGEDFGELRRENEALRALLARAREAYHYFACPHAGQWHADLCNLIQRALTVPGEKAPDE